MLSGAQVVLIFAIERCSQPALNNFLVSGHFGEGLFELLSDPLQLLLLHHQLVLQPVDLRASVVEQRVVGHLHLVMMMKIMMMMVTSGSDQMKKSTKKVDPFQN